VTEIARSLVYFPPSTVSMTVDSKDSQKFLNPVFPSNLALWSKPLVQAKIEAIELVEVSYPFSCYLKCLVTVPWAASDSTTSPGATKTEVISPRDPYP